MVLVRIMFMMITVMVMVMMRAAPQERACTRRIIGVDRMHNLGLSVGKRGDAILDCSSKRRISPEGVAQSWRTHGIIIAWHLLCFPELVYVEYMEAYCTAQPENPLWSPS